MSTGMRHEDVRENPRDGSSRQNPVSMMLGTRDLIALGVYSALYIVVMFIAGMPFAFSPVLTYALPVSAAFFCAPVYLLLVAKVPRRGAVAALVLGAAAGEVSALGRFRSPGLNTVGYMVFALAPLASYVMVWLNQSYYRDYLEGKGTDRAYMSTMLDAASQWLLVAVVLGTLLAAWLGTLLGRRMLARHFTRAGIVA